MAYEWQSDIIRPDGENGTEVLDGQGVYQPQIEGGDNITIEDGRINASGTLENVQANFAETNPSDPSYIKNKPDLSAYATDSELTAGLATKQDIISDLDTIRSGASAGATAVQPGSLATVATSGSYADLSNKPTIPTVDQTYSAASTNAQSGVAVAQAIASIPSASYTAGDGIAIDNDEISVKVGNGLTLGDGTRTETESLICSQISATGTPYATDVCAMTQDLATIMNTTDGLTITLSKPFEASGSAFLVAIADVSRPYEYAFFGSVSATPDGTHMTFRLAAGTSITIKFSDYDSTYSQITIADILSNLSNYNLVFVDASTGELARAYLSSRAPETTATYQKTTIVADSVCVANPLPASAQADSGKVLKVNASGNAEWGTDGFTTTAGITDIQQVNALPANPVATVLYLIPEA